MPDILEEKIHQFGKVKVLTFTCGKCERHFLTLETTSGPWFCPFCREPGISENDEFEITFADSYETTKK